MRTAASIINSFITVKNDSTDATMADLENIVNEARKEAIIECAEKAMITESVGFSMSTDFTFSISCERDYDYSINKQSILNLINELQ